ASCWCQWSGTRSGASTWTHGGSRSTSPSSASGERRAQMEIDVFTLFPEWFQWFRDQRHVRNALAAGSTLECLDIRAHSPLGGGQVDDTPFGGGAGMVLRVDVMDCALRARYGVNP